MGLIKAAILIGAGSYVISKLTSKHREHQNSSKPSKNFPEGEERSLQRRNSNEEFVTEGNRELPAYSDAKDNVQFQGVREKDGWNGSEKEIKR